MGRRCCVAGCNSTSRLPEHHGVTYHSFPLEAAIRSVWIRNTRFSSDRQITKSVLVCSRHFRRADFQPQRSGKYLLKYRVFPTVFPWGKMDQAQVDADIQYLATASTAGGNVEGGEEATKATVEATVAQIMAETAELNAAAATKAQSAPLQEPEIETPSSPVAKFEAVTSFNPGARLEAQDFDGVWHGARVVEVDNDDREVLIKFERSGKSKSSVIGTEEWIPMNSTRLRQKVNKQLLVFELEEKCMARWSGPRKFPGTIKKVLGNDVYEVLFDDGYVKNVRALHMTKLSLTPDPEDEKSTPKPTTIPSPGLTPPLPIVSQSPKPESAPPKVPTSTTKKRSSAGSRKDWPLIDITKLDLASLNLPAIPRDGEWTCHWVNDQPIGREGFLIVGEHRKPTVIVEDWRLPKGWVKHMYQRSNLLGKWDVILVTPTGKRFRSKSDLKIYLEELGQSYNPDIYDFSIHRRRAKDINAYAFTPDYKPQPVVKKSAHAVSLSTDSSDAIASSLSTPVRTKFIETPVATPVPPLELMTPTTGASGVASPASEGPPGLVSTPDIPAAVPAEEGYAYIGGLKVQIVDNLFRCPQEGCTKNFRKENHLQIHVKHYHQDLIKLLGTCPKMQELAEKHTYKITPEPHDIHPKNQIPNQEFFAKLHQQDLQQSRSHRKFGGGATGTAMALTTSAATGLTGAEKEEVKLTTEQKKATESKELAAENVQASPIAISPVLNQSLSSPKITDEIIMGKVRASPFSSCKRPRLTPTKRPQGARKSSRQRTTRRYFTGARAGGSTILPPVIITGDSSFGGSELEETRSSFNVTPDGKTAAETKKRRTATPSTPFNTQQDSLITADSIFTSQPLQSGLSKNESEPAAASGQPQYIKENGELIKIVRMRQEEIINCLCSYGEEDGLMIQCELCLCWQHGFCNGIDKESDVPDKYVCYLCRNPPRPRESMRYKHDQDWLYEGKLPVANYHIANPNSVRRFEFLKKSHTLTGNLIELKRFMHSLRVKINIANNRVHPKLYLWAKKWDEDVKAEITNEDVKKSLDTKGEFDDLKSDGDLLLSPSKKVKMDSNLVPAPIIPQPEAPIDTVECQHRLLEHISVQQNRVMNRLSEIEAEIEEIEKMDDLPDLKGDDGGETKDVLSSFIKELDTVKLMASLNCLENIKKAESTSNPA